MSTAVVTAVEVEVCMRTSEHREGQLLRLAQLRLRCQALAVLERSPDGGLYVCRTIIENKFEMREKGNLLSDVSGQESVVSFDYQESFWPKLQCAVTMAGVQDVHIAMLTMHAQQLRSITSLESC
jgi:hypothetical protein